MRRVREGVRIPLATNTVVINFEQLAANILNPAVDVILLDTTFWGGIRPCIKAAGVCETFQLGIAVHSSGELGIQLATMLHLGAVVPNLAFKADAHYHQLVDDIITGGKMTYVDGAIRVPSGPGLGVGLDRDKLATYADLYKSLGGYLYDRDPARPDWFPLLPQHALGQPRRSLAADHQVCRAFPGVQTWCSLRAIAVISSTRSKTCNRLVKTNAEFLWFGPAAPSFSAARADAAYRGGKGFPRRF